MRFFTILLLTLFYLFSQTLKADVVEEDILSLTEEHELMMPEGLMAYTLSAYPAANAADGNLISDLVFEIEG